MRTKSMITLESLTGFVFDPSFKLYVLTGNSFDSIEDVRKTLLMFKKENDMFTGIKYASSILENSLISEMIKQYHEIILKNRERLGLQYNVDIYHRPYLKEGRVSIDDKFKENIASYRENPKSKIAEFLIKLNDEKQFHLHSIYNYFRLIVKNRVFSGNGVNDDVLDSPESFNLFLTSHRFEIDIYEMIWKGTYPAICALFDMSEIYNGIEDSFIYESLNLSYTYDIYSKMVDFPPNPEHLRQRNCMLSAYMEKRVPDLIEIGAIEDMGLSLYNLLRKE